MAATIRLTMAGSSIVFVLVLLSGLDCSVIGNRTGNSSLPKSRSKSKDSLNQRNPIQFPMNERDQIQRPTPPKMRNQLAAYPSPDEDGTYFVVNLAEPPKSNREVSKDLITFHLYTRDDNGTETVDEIRIGDLEPSWLHNFKQNSPLKILCHGYKSSPEKPFPANMKAFWTSGNSVNVNVVLMGWEALARSDFYLDAVNNLRLVGERATEMIEYLFGFSVFKMSDVHFIGHNLGAHIGGIVGQLLQIRLGRMGRITGLDPAGLKNCDSDLDRLDPSDAEFVDGIHTDDGFHCGEQWTQGSNQRETFMRSWGYGGRVGHADFYPNSGHDQPWKPEKLDTCGLCRSYRFMMDSLLEENRSLLEACKCESWESYEHDQCDCKEKAVLGEFVSKRANGSYYLRIQNRVS